MMAAAAAAAERASTRRDVRGGCWIWGTSAVVPAALGGLLLLFLRLSARPAAPATSATTALLYSFSLSLNTPARAFELEFVRSRIFLHRSIHILLPRRLLLLQPPAQLYQAPVFGPLSHHLLAAPVSTGGTGISLNQSRHSLLPLPF